MANPVCNQGRTDTEYRIRIQIVATLSGWGHGADQDTSKAIFNAYVEAGGNFIDGADVYQFGQSEELLGTLLEGRRENFILATKYSTGCTTRR